MKIHILISEVSDGKTTRFKGWRLHLITISCIFMGLTNNWLIFLVPDVSQLPKKQPRNQRYSALEDFDKIYFAFQIIVSGIILNQPKVFDCWFILVKVSYQFISVEFAGSVTTANLSPVKTDEKIPISDKDITIVSCLLTGLSLLSAPASLSSEASFFWDD